MRGVTVVPLALLFILLGCDEAGKESDAASTPPSVDVRKAPAPATTPREKQPKKVRPVLPGSLPPGLFEKTSCAVADSKGCEKSCAKGRWEACAAWAVLLENGWGVPRDLKRASQVASPACEHGNAMACGVLGAIAASKGKGAEDGVRGAQLLFDACESGDALACERLGASRADKKLPDYDAGRALQYYLKACDAGHWRACVSAASLIEEEGLATSRDVEALWRGPCEAGFAYSCSRWARATRKGLYGKADPGLASERYDEACRLGHVMSCE